MRYAAVVLGLVLLLIVVLLALPRAQSSGGISASGIIEATQSEVAPKVQGRLIALRVHDGDRVRKGQVVAVLEQTTPDLNADQARANVSAALAQVAAAQAGYDLQSSTYLTQVAQAEQGVRIAQAGVGQASQSLEIERRAAAVRVGQAQAQLGGVQSAYALARTELARTRSLTASGDVAQRALDAATAQYRASAAQLQNARQALVLAQADERNIRIRELAVGASRSTQRQSLATLAAARDERQLVAQRQAQMQAAQAALAQARAAQGLASEQVRETQLRAPFDGVAVSHTFEVGDLVSPGSPVITVADLTHPYLNVYVNETEVPNIRTGMRVFATVDALPNRRFSGTVTEIASSAEFTPENVQTREQRIEYLVFRVKIQFTDTTGILKPGLPADAVIDV